MNTIYHLSTITAPVESYSADSLHTEGFIHCCLLEQLPGVIQRYYKDTSSIHLLTINPSLLQAELVYENTSGGDELFPHVYGNINTSAVTGVQTLDKTQLSAIVQTGRLEVTTA